MATGAECIRSIRRILRRCILANILRTRRCAGVHLANSFAILSSMSRSSIGWNENPFLNPAMRFRMAGSRKTGCRAVGRCGHAGIPCLEKSVFASRIASR
jgi:hypothetical protein